LIVVSGALVVVALVLLVAGIVVSGLTLVYISIGLSAVSGALLAVGVLLSRGEAARKARSGAVGTATPLTGGVGAAGTSGAPETAAATDTALVVPATGSGPVVDDAGAGVDGAGSDLVGSSATVLVVSGRPRYHAAGCRFVAGRADAQELAVDEARELGFTPCGACRPDGRPTGRRPGRIGGAEPAGAAGLTGDSAETGADGAALQAAGGAPTLVEQDPAAASPMVVVIPDRPRFHRTECRFVRGAQNTMTLSRQAAQQQGFAACGVCKP
jgi:hypothetical protein